MIGQVYEGPLPGMLCEVQYCSTTVLASIYLSTMIGSRTRPVDLPHYAIWSGPAHAFALGGVVRKTRVEGHIAFTASLNDNRVTEVMKLAATSFRFG
jgi:hypothetical protein